MAVAAIVAAETDGDYQGPFACCWLLKAENGRKRWWCDGCAASSTVAMSAETPDDEVKRLAADHIRRVHSKPQR